jgi:diaminohydroxyphosphoribosylaminopyrimidine deaminase / 5-amino-6-(5-phosphoribosylamino)uracil reductase
MNSDFDIRMMQRAILLAEHGAYTTKPNPRVGCVITRGADIIGEGWHQRAGEAHAEVNALRHLADASGACAYVTLEPCSHTGRTPPCADALIRAGLARVVIASADPNPLVNGGGVAKLKAAGIEVVEGVLRAEADALNPGFLRRMQTGLPWVRGKIASSIDGRIALSNGESKWLTGVAARYDGHRLRARACAIVSGLNTVLRDDSRLDARLLETDAPFGIAQPVKIILDRDLALPADRALLQNGRVILAHQAPKSAIMAAMRRLSDAPCELEFIALDPRAPLPSLLRECAQRSFNELHLEGGGRLLGSFVNENLLDELVHYQAPLLLGADALPMANITGVQSLNTVSRWRLRASHVLEGDLKTTWLRS